MKLKNKNPHPTIPKMIVTKSWEKFPTRFNANIFLLDDFLKYNAFAPYSPILFGVIKDAVKDAKLCFAASEKEIFCACWTNNCHFLISEIQLKKVKINKKSIFFDEKTSFFIKIEVKLENDCCWFVKIFS